MLFTIAEHRVRVVFENTNMELLNLRSFSNFTIEDDGGDVPLEVLVDDGLHTLKKDVCRLLREVDTGNGVIAVFRHVVDDEKLGYQFIIHDVFGHACALLIADEEFRECRCALRGNSNMRQYGFNSVMMLAYAFSVASLQTVLVHASLVRKDGKGYAFCAKSGTGKSTQVSNWLRYLPDCDLMNDDNPIFRVMPDGEVFVYGSPWSGKTPCYRNVKAPLGGVAQIVRDTTNYLEQLKSLDAFVTLIPSCSTMKWDRRVYKSNCETISNLLEKVNVYNLHCLPDADSARVASEGMEYKLKDCASTSSVTK